MMKINFIKLLTSLSALVLATIVPAQNLPVLTPDPSVKHGVLPNGLSYYIVTNQSVKGHADFALVQKVGWQTDTTAADRAVAVAKDALASLPRIKSSSPQAWLASHGVNPSDKGFINISPEATVFRFDNVSLSSGKNVLDSTLVLLMSIVERSSVSDDEFLSKWYSPSDQAIVISGDVDAGALISRIEAMSYMVSESVRTPRKEYEWVEMEQPVFEVIPSDREGLAYVHVEWKTPRAPREYMNTIQPAIYERFVNVLSYIVRRRVVADLERRSVAFAEVGSYKQNSSEGGGHEIFRIYAHVEDESVNETIGAIARACASVDAASVSVDEFCVARAVYLQNLFEVSSDPYKNNSDYVDRCISAFLYNASLASAKEKLDFNLSREMSDERQLGLFNDMAAALLDGSRNIYVRCEAAPEFCDETQVRNSFYAAWSDSYANPSSLDAFYETPTVVMPGFGPKVKLESTKQDPMSGSTLWTFSNGFKVAYKKMKTADRTYWTMALNGGYGNIKNLSEGEGAFVGDYFETCRIGGIEGRVFKDYLMSQGMTLDMKVGMTGTLLSGQAPEDKTGNVLQSLLLIANERTADKEAYESYMNREELYLAHLNDGRASRIAAIDSIMCPDYVYSWMKSPGKLTDSFASKADDFYTELSGRMNDGMLIIVSNKDEAEMKKLLMSYIGGFRTSDSATGRPVVRYQPNSGWSVYTVDGNEESIDIAMSAARPLTMNNYMSAALAAMILDKALGSALKETGMCADVSYNFVITPQERLSMSVSVEPLARDAYASHIDPSGSIEALAVIRSMMFDLTQTAIPSNVLASCKSALKSLLARRMTSPEYWLDAIAKRYLDGKDFTTSYASKVDAVTPEMIREVFSVLNGGSKIEYVVRNTN